MKQNEQLDLAFNFLQFTDKNVFLTGKAGTGKTTFLHNLKNSSHKRMAVVAPTGVAAINAGGVTIHSFFQLPFGPYIPEDSKTQPNRRFAKDKINLIRSLDLLVIDEISMVRADTLDGIDEVLRRYRDRNRAFGGIQLLMIGDLHQLSPVVRDEDWAILKAYYSTLYFFGSRALQKTELVNIELKHIYRQADPVFIGLLNKVRNNQLDREVLEQLNSRHIPNFRPDDNEGYITLTTHNRLAQEINEQKLKDLDGKTYRFNAEIDGEFPEYTYPTEPDLELKTGAQVMFVKNDPSRERLFYNGKIGKITRIEDGSIYVKCAGERGEIAAGQLSWQNIKYELNADSKEIEEKVIGTFTQYPLKLAWAITIHKSQGLTFEKAIIDANAAFAHGQVYVALSRCKSFEGMVLSSPISVSGVRTDSTVAEYTRAADQNAPDELQLKRSKIAYQQSLIFDLFDFQSLKNALFYLRKIAEDNHSSLAETLVDDINAIIRESEKHIYAVADAFKRQLSGVFSNGEAPEESETVQERVKKASGYFHEKLEALLDLPISRINTETDNKAVRTTVNEALSALQKEVFVKKGLTSLCKERFSTQLFLKTRGTIEIELNEVKSVQKATVIPENVPHPNLYATIRNWRNNLAQENNCPVYHILPQKTLLELVKLLPVSLSELAAVKGLGKMKVKQFGDDLLRMINEYCISNEIERVPIEPLAKKEKSRIDTGRVSFDLFKEGKSIAEIAELRGFTAGTIETHLSSFIQTGELSVFDIVPKVKVAKIMAYVVQHRTGSLTEIKTAMGDAISYSEIKAVLKHLTFINSESGADSGHNF